MGVGPIAEEQVVVLSYCAGGVADADCIARDDGIGDADGAFGDEDGRATAHGRAGESGVHDLDASGRVEIQTCAQAAGRDVASEQRVDQQTGAGIVIDPAATQVCDVIDELGAGQCQRAGRIQPAAIIICAAVVLEKSIGHLSRTLHICAAALGRRGIADELGAGQCQRVICK